MQIYIDSKYSITEAVAIILLLTLHEAMALPSDQPAQCSCRPIYPKFQESCPCYYTQNLPTTCAEAMEWAGKNAEDGIYVIYLPNSGLQPFSVYCISDVNDGPAWTVVQRRKDGSVNFYRNWEDYKTGFGNQDGEYFIGLEKLYWMTHAERNELWIKMEDIDNEWHYVRYDNFSIGNEASFYTLNSLGKFRGNLGDAMLVHQGQKFTTMDADHDMSPLSNCAKLYSGAWWYRDCHDSNLNGRYLIDRVYNAEGIVWCWPTGNKYQLKYVHMAIRPRRPR